jgi:hypothetical protein
VAQSRFISAPPAAGITGSGSLGSSAWLISLNFTHSPVKRPLPSVNFAHNNRVADLDDSPCFGTRINTAARFREFGYVLLVGH